MKIDEFVELLDYLIELTEDGSEEDKGSVQ